MTTEHLERVKALALLEEPCPQRELAYEGEPDAQILCPHSEHGYTGQRPRFPMLRGEPHNQGIHGYKPDGEHRILPIRCKDVGCPGWDLVTTTDALLEAGKPYKIRVSWRASRDYWVATGYVKNWPFSYVGANPVEALSNVLVALTEEEKHPNFTGESP